MNCAGIILAAGASRRMGRPKALLAFEGETFADRLVGVFSRRCTEVVVVLGHHEQALRQGMRRKARLVVNPDPDRGMLSSLQCGLQALQVDFEGVLFTPVDYPAIRESTVAALVRRLEEEPSALAAIPVFQGRRGHPAAIRRALAEELLAAPPGSQARDVIGRYRDRTIFVDADDPGAVTDVDDPEAYRRLLAEAAP